MRAWYGESKREWEAGLSPDRLIINEFPYDWICGMGITIFTNPLFSSGQQGSGW